MTSQADATLSRDHETAAPPPPEVAIRADFMNESGLHARGSELARADSFAATGGLDFDFHRRNDENARFILDAYRELNRAQMAGDAVTPAAQWLLDNHYVVEETLRQVRRDLPPRFFRQLPAITIDGRRMPRVLAMAWSVVAHTDSAVNPDLLSGYVEGYQSVRPLSIGELWALPSMLRFVLVENLRRLAKRVLRAREMRRIANQAADDVLASSSDGAREGILRAHAVYARDATFATQLLYRLRDGSQNSGLALTWLERELERHGSDAERIAQAEHETLTGGNVTTGNIIRSLRRINDTEWTDWFENVSRIDAYLRENANYAGLDFASRNLYRSEIERLAKRSGKTEMQVTEAAVSLSRTAEEAGDCDSDIGFFLTGPRRAELEKAVGCRASRQERLARLWRRTGWAGIVVPVGLITLGFLAVTGAVLNAYGYGAAAILLLLAVAAIPASEAALGLFNTVVLFLTSPTRTVGYEYKDGVPPEARTLVVVPTLIGSRSDVDDSLRTIEVHYLANMDGDVHFAILSDWPDSSEEQGDGDIEILDYARAQVAALNARHPREQAPLFHILHRRRLYNEAQGCWMGWERKRGKLHELNLLLRGDADTTFFPPDADLPTGVVHVVTLDADTRMTRDAVNRLAGKLAHPTNRPVIREGRVARGYSIMQPRITASLTTGDEASFFQRVFSANRGLDPYVFAVSDVYQDLFGEGTFTGKGIYHVDAMEAALAGRIPENAVLSHDLLEGAFARAALVTDVELVEDYPTRYMVDASRHHRWARGDWQLLPFLFARSSAISGLSRWKMADNLRRSLTPLSWIAASVAGWSLLPASGAALWQAVLLVSLFVGPTLDILTGIVPRRRDIAAGGHFQAVMRDFAFGTAQVAFKCVLIAHQAWLMADAIIRTLHRVYFSRRNLLEWRTASQSMRDSGRDLTAHFSAMSGSVVIGAVAFLVVLAAGGSGIWLAAIFALMWAGAPAFAWLVSRPEETEESLAIPAAETRFLRRTARRTWSFFDAFVTKENNWLPPDNFQEVPAPLVAHRTSPTNIGMYLLSVVSARDFGWIALPDAVVRLERTLDTLDTLPRFKGHIYNWYDTRSLEPLHPAYISTVDSGNLAGHLLTVAGACRDWAAAPAAYLEGDLTGVIDVVEILDEALEALPDDRRQLRPLRQRLRQRIEGMRRAVETIMKEPETAAIRTINLAVLATDLRRLSAALHEETGSAASAELDSWAEALTATCEAHVSDAHATRETVTALRTRFSAIAERARRYALEMDFTFLFREERKLFSIGYRVQDRELDEACYDLLASEARLASLFAIAKGDVATEHWFRLGRPVTQIGMRAALMSWSGSMFEYLMPPLVMKEPVGGLLNQTSKLVIRRQIAHGKALGVPWGISEAAFHARDREMNYQYTNFGVPGLGLKRGLAANTVIAPYATILACQFSPSEAVSNLKRLEEAGGLGRYGYFDALDYTPRRVPEGRTHAVVRNYMAHHQGMSIVAIGNALLEGRMRDRFHSDPVIEAAELLLQEKAPRDIPLAPDRAPVEAPDIAAIPSAEGEQRIISDPLAATRAVSLHSNGRYAMMLTATGSGSGRLDDVAVTRWRPDPVEDRLGTYVFLRDRSTREWWSATVEPRRAPDEKAWTVFSDDKATFVKSVDGLRTELECIVVSEGHGEGRRLTIHNETEHDRHLEVTSFGELALAPEAADSAHPAFSKLFVETSISSDMRVIRARRRKRGSGDPDIAFAHFVVDAGGGTRQGSAETDRRAFIGRGRQIENAAAFDDDTPLSGGQGFVLDPAFALRRIVRVPARKQVALTFWSVVANSVEAVDETIQRLDHVDAFARQAMMAWTRSQVQTRHLDISLAEAASIQKLARHLLYPDHTLRAPAETIAAGLGPQSALWPMAISGDFPIFAVRIDNIKDIAIVDQALRAQEYFRSHGLLADLVVINEQASTYAQELQHAIEARCENARLRGNEFGPRQHIFAVRRDLMDEVSYRTLVSVARALVHARNGTLFDQIERAEAQSQPLALAPPAPFPTFEGSVAPSGDGLALWNGYGGIGTDGAYEIRLSGMRVTPQPWINVLSNGLVGCHVSAEGTTYNWAGNSRDFPVTPWSNDPVVDRPAEGFYVTDIASGRHLSPMAALLRDPLAKYTARHEPGTTRLSVERDGLRIDLDIAVHPSEPARLSRLTVRNAGSSGRSLRIHAYLEWALGIDRGRYAPTIVPEAVGQGGVIIAANPYHPEHGNRKVAFASSLTPSSITTDRAEFLGTGGSARQPAAVLSGVSLSGTVEAGRDSCAAQAFEIECPAGEARSIDFILASETDRGRLDQLLARLMAEGGEVITANARALWDARLDAVSVETPDPAFDALVSRWLPYQSHACRVLARAAFYQTSGAYGFRDQLQDTLALMWHDPSLARDQILNAAARQFEEGDVQHWWLAETGAGVRTMISDDVVWLAHGTAHYVGFSGDSSILDERLPFLTGQPLAEGQHDSFFQPERTTTEATLYDHCARALDLAIERSSPRGIPLILGGDWNDGMNRVGEKGHGESVWLGWFLARALEDFIAIAEKRGETDHAKRWRQHLDRLTAALEEHAWDGSWYRRGTYDDGSPLGSSDSLECRIDSLSQSWSVLSGKGDPERARQAMDAVLERLVDDEARAVRLFEPAFSGQDRDPGYIASYPPGVRENGGQYTHAAAWVVLALAQQKRGNDAWRLYSLINPFNHARNAQEAERYRVEPYVAAADVYSGGALSGRGGWTWYTGSSGWLFRAALEGILGIRRLGSKLVVDPSIPDGWDGFTVRLTIGGTRCRIAARRASSGEEPSLTANGADIAQGSEIDIPISGELVVDIVLPVQNPVQAGTDSTRGVEEAGRPAALGKTIGRAAAE